MATHPSDLLNISLLAEGKVRLKPALVRNRALEYDYPHLETLA